MMLVNRDVILVEYFLEFEMQGKSRRGTVSGAGFAKSTRTMYVII